MSLRFAVSNDEEHGLLFRPWDNVRGDVTRASGGRGVGAGRSAG
jgi:hypothetical protein